jgi:ketosteroid isomerase-like protein
MPRGSSRTLVLLVCLVFPAACAAPRADSPDPAALAASLLAADRAFDSATAASRLEGWVGFFADSGRQIDRHGDFVIGHPAIRAHMAGFLGDTSYQLRWQPDHARVSGDGTLGYTLGRAETLKRQGDSSVVVGRSRYLTVWRKQADGSWKVDADIGTDVE